jgi:hypothetical protein
MGLAGTQAGELLEGISCEMHMHMPMCNHARGGPEEYAAGAQARNLAGIVAAWLKNTGD